MNRQTADRLRAAFAAKAEQLTDERLTQFAAQRQQSLTGEPGDTSWSHAGESATAFMISAETDLGDDVTVLETDRATSPGRHTRWLASVLAAAAVVALAVGVTAISTRNSGMARPAKPAGPALLGANQQADRTAIPWGQVGAGWTVALWTAATLNVPKDLVPVRPQTVYLVNPIGGRYLIDTMTGNYALRLADWSTDVRTALLTRQGASSTEVIRLDLASGQTHSFLAKGKVHLAKFTRPSGEAILLERPGSAIERVSLMGAHQLTYPVSRTTDMFTVSHPLFSPDGRTLVLDSDRGLVARAEDGTLRRAVAAPPGGGACSPVRWWNADSVLAACEGSFNHLYVVPILAAGPVTALAAQADPENPFTVAWHLDSGVLLLNYASNCGVAALGELDNTGHIVDRRLPTGLNGYGMSPVGATSSAVTFVTALSCDRNYAPALVSYDPGTNRLTRLLGPGLNGGSVLDAYGFGSTDHP